MSRSIKDILKRGPRNSEELALKRLHELHPNYTPKTLAQTLESIVSLETKINHDTEEITR